MSLSPEYQRIVDEVADAVYYQHDESTQRDRLRASLTMLAEVLVQDIQEAAAGEPAAPPAIESGRRIARLEWANANMRATLSRLRSWAGNDPTGPVDAHGVAAWVKRVIDHGLEIGEPANLPEPPPV